MTQRVVIVGAGHAAAQLAPSLRKQGWEGEIVILAVVLPVTAMWIKHGSIKSVKQVVLRKSC